MRRLAWFGLSFGLAALSAIRLLPPRMTWMGGLICLGVGLLLPFLLPRKYRKPLRWVSCGLALGLLWTTLWCQQVLSPHQAVSTERTIYHCVLTDYPQPSTYGWKVCGKLEHDGLQTDTLFYLKDSPEVEPLCPGDELLAVAVCKPAADSSLSKSVLLTASVKNYAVMGHQSSLRYLPARCSHWLKGQIGLLMDGDVAGLVTAMLTGDRSGLSEPLSTALRRVGLSHIVAISGTHLSLLAYAGLKLFRGKTARLCLAPVLIFFALMVESVSCWRALLMFLLMLVAPFFHRQEDGLTSLGFALTVILLVNPYAVISVGLQLSFSAMAGIFLLEPPLRRLARDWRDASLLPKPVIRLLSPCITIVTFSLCATAFTLPLCALYFGQISLLSPLSMLLVNWALPALFLGGLSAALLAGFCMPLAQLISPLVGLAARYIIAVSTGLSRWNFAALSMEHLSGLIWLGILYGVVAVTLLSRRLRRRWYLSAALIVGLLAGITGYHRWYLLSPNLTVEVLDVGQGQCLLFLFGDKAIALDCGGNSYDSAGDLLADELQALGRSSLDLLIVTHCDSDHINGAEELFARIQVDALALPAGEEPDRAAPLLALAEEQSTEITQIDCETVTQWGQAVLTLYPPEEAQMGNEASLAALFTCGDYSLLVTGDRDADQEEALLEEYGLSSVSTLMVGHHGSKYSTSEAFLDAITPEQAVISVGSNNYGHPTQEVLDRLRDRNIPVSRTDEDGTLIYRISQTESQ